MAEYYRYEKYQKYINGVPADPPEYKQGELIGTGEYDSLSDCESDAIYEWRVVSQSDYICDGYSSYYKEYKFKSLDNGQTWIRTGQTRKGELKNQYAPECGWSIRERWTSTGVTRCSGSNLMEEFVKEVSYDMGKTWIVSQPAEYKYEVKEYWYKDCVLELDPLEFEVTTEEPNVPIWIELQSAGLSRYFINWGESEHTAEYDMDTPSYRYIMTDNRLSPYTGAPFSYTYAKAGTYTIKLWVNNIKIIGGIWRSITQRNPANTTHMTQFKYTDKYTYKIKSFGNLPNSYLEGINLSGTPLTELCSDEYGFLGSENFTSCILTEGSSSQVENVRHFNYDMYDGYESSVDYTVTTLIEQAFDVANTKLTTIPQDIFKYATHMGGVRFANCRIQSIPKELFVNCVGLQSCAESFRETDITDIPEGLFDSCTDLKAASGAFRETNIVNCPRLWTNYPTITSYMFYNCKQLESIASTFKVNIDFQQYMFYGCTKLSNPQIIINDADIHGHYNISHMYQNSGVTSIPDTLFSLLSTYYIINASYMFEGCKNLLSMSGTITNQDVNVDLHHMFANSGLTNIDLKFPNILTTHDANCLRYMFEGCVDLTTLNTDMFNFNATSLDILYMFKDCKKLTNWPIAEEHNLWDYPCFYNPESLPNHIDYQYTFTGCSKIASEVPIEFGGYKSPYAPVIIQTDATSITIDGSHASTVIRVEGGDTYSVPQTLTLPEGTSTIYIYVATGTWRVTSNTYYKILDFGGGGMISSSSNADYITYLGTDQGAFKTTTRFPLTNLKNVEEVSPDFLKSGTNINSVENLFRYNKKLTSIPEGTFSKLTNLSGADRVCKNSKLLQIVDGMFEGCANLISAYEAFGDCDLITSAQRTFKDCTSLSDIRNIFGVNPQYIPLAVNCNQLFENTAVTGFYPNMSSFLKLSSAIGMFRNNSKLTKVDCKFTLVGDNVDLTEMFKDCPLLTNRQLVVFSISEGSTANFTRCWQNCAALIDIPKVQYAGKTMNPWEVPNAVGTECFNGCTSLLENYGDQIPDGWK